MRPADALGAFLQNPVTRVASLCGPTKEILSLRLHPMQNSLTNEELYEAIERVMVTVVNQVGNVSFSSHGVLFLVVATCFVLLLPRSRFKLYFISLNLSTFSCHDSFWKISIYILKNEGIMKGILHVLLWYGLHNAFFTWPIWGILVQNICCHLGALWGIQGWTLLYSPDLCFRIVSIQDTNHFWGPA